MPKPVRRLATSLIVAGLLVGCGTTTFTGSPVSPAAPPTQRSQIPPPTAPMSPTTGPSSEASPSPVRLPTQSTVEWGRIWDALPPGFPRPAGAVPSEVGVAASGVFDLTEDVTTASSIMRGALESAGFRTEGMSGPLEDGSVVIDSTGPTTGCRMQTTLVRHGGVTMMTVLYGASCPFG